LVFIKYLIDKILPVNFDKFVILLKSKP